MKTLSIAAGWLLLCGATPAWCAAQTELFNSGSSAAADGWVDFNDNKSGTNSSGVAYTVNYGFSNTGYAGDPAGEAGGIFQNPSFPSYYADLFSSALAITNSLSANGKFVLRTQASNMNVFIGHFLRSSLNNVTNGSTALCQIGIGLAEYNPTYGGNGRFYPYVNYPNGTYNRGGNAPLLAPVTNQVYNWGYTFNPTGGSGYGTLTVNVTNATTLKAYSSTLTLSAAAAGMTFDAFGWVEPTFPASEVSPDPGEAYIDSVNYTVPAAVAPCISVSPSAVSISADSTDQQATVTIPASMNGSQAAFVTVTSQNAAVAAPVGAVNGSLTLEFPAGTNSQTFFISGISPGSTTLVLSDTNNVCISNSISVTVSPSQAGTFLKSQTFDSSNSAAAGGWIGYNNTAGGNGANGAYTVAFGFSATSYAGPSGEAGGAFQNPGFPAYYADVFDAGQTIDPDVLTISNVIFANGTFVLSTVSSNMNVFIGHFLTSSLNNGPTGFVQIGLALAEYSPTYGGNGRLYPYISYSNGTYNRGGNAPLLAPVTNQVYNWGYLLNPSGGTGYGALTVNVTNAGTGQTYASTLDLTSAASGMTFDAFGLMEPEFVSTETGPDPGVAYIDSVTYTAPIPQVPTLQFALSNTGNLETVSPVVVNVTLSRVQTQTITVNYSVSGGTASNGVNYILFSGTLTFQPGETNQSISIPILDNSNPANGGGSETIVLSLSGASGGAALGSTTNFTYTIINPLPPAILSVQPSGSNVVLSWPSQLYYYQLQQRANLVQPPDWANVTATPNVVNDQFQVVLLATGAQQFFRLAPSFPAIFTNTLGMVFREMTPGSFTMGVGSNPTMADTGNLFYDEQPAHTVTLTRPFYMLSATVSQAQYASTGLPGAVTDVSWNNAAAFCSWLSQYENLPYRLPTEAEWNYVYDNPQGVGGFSAPEWVQDWHWIYQDDVLMDPVGPLVGLCKVIRTDATNRFTEPPDATSSPWGFNPATFRVVLPVYPATNPFVGPTPYNFAAVKQSTAPSLQGPDSALPYFTVRFALPIPPVNDTNYDMALTGLDQSVAEYNHSPGLTILPNGDALAIYFSAPEGNENTSLPRFSQARLRYGAEEWDMPELFWDLKNFNDQSCLLWTDGSTIRFFGGGRLESGVGQQFNGPWLPFKMATSTNNGASWTMSLPYLDAAANDFTAQPITSAFRDPSGSIYFAMDASGDNSFLWRSQDGGVTWHDMGGRTGGRHSQIVPLDNFGDLVSYGGKDTSVNGYMPMNTSSNWGASWSASVQSPFAPLSTGQRPCLITLADGNLLLVGDSVMSGVYTTPPGWTNGTAPYVAISTNQGASWQFKSLPVTLPEDYSQGGTLTKDAYGTLGYATVRQAPNGVIHLLTTLTYPNIQYEFNESWLNSTNGDMIPESTGGTIQPYSENYPNGALHATWSARICPHGRYLLDGLETSYYQNGQMEHQATWSSGRRTGTETYWSPNGILLTSWNHNLSGNTSTWIHWYANGRMRVESVWNTNPTAADLNRVFRGLVANGAAYGWNEDGTPAYAYNYVNGTNAGTLALPAPQP
jgi:antitoxin component YwqK of YwqJK toxin-antitoxin module